MVCNLASSYSLTVEEPAIVAFIDSSGILSEATTDDSSRFQLELSSGNYSIVVRSPYGYPPDTTYGLQLLPGDTALTASTHVRTWDPAMFTFAFNCQESITVAEEWAVLNYLNGQTQVLTGKAVPAFAFRETDSPTVRIVEGDFIKYEFPVIREDSFHGELYNVVEVERLLTALIRDDAQTFLPPGLVAYTSGGIGCPR